MSGNDATFPEGPYDLVFANLVVHRIHDKEALFRRVYENLKPGGRFAFSTANGNPVWPPIANDCMSELFWPDFIATHHSKRSFLKCYQYQELAASHGFDVMSMEEKEEPGIQVENVNDLVEFFFGLLQGELDRGSISEQALKACRDNCKYDDVLRSEAELHLKVMKLLYIIMTKPQT